MLCHIVKKIDAGSMKDHYVKCDNRLEISSTRKGIILINIKDTVETCV